LVRGKWKRFNDLIFKVLEVEFVSDLLERVLEEIVEMHGLAYGIHFIELLLDLVGSLGKPRRQKEEKLVDYSFAVVFGVIGLGDADEYIDRNRSAMKVDGELGVK
jgi:hypothetical protein